MGYIGEAVPFLGEIYLSLLCLEAYVFMTVQDDLGTERRVRTELDRYVSPIRVHNVEGIMVDVGQRCFLSDIDRPTGELADIENRGRRTTDQDAKYTPCLRVLKDIALRNLMFAFVFLLAVNHGNAFVFGISMNSTAKSSGESHEVGIVKRAIVTH